MKIKYYHKLLLIIFLSLYNSTLTAATYVNTSGQTLTIIDTRTNSPHEYDGTNLAPGANISGAQLGYTDLNNADLRGANITTTSFWISNLRNADFSNAIGSPSEFYLADLTNAKLKDMDLSYVDLSYGDFTNADMRNCTFVYANTSGSIFTNADLRYADLTLSTSVNWAASWSGTKLYGATLPGGTYDQTWFESQGATFAVPEPSTFALLIGCLALSSAFLKRRFKS